MKTKKMAMGGLASLARPQMMNGGVPINESSAPMMPPAKGGPMMKRGGKVPMKKYAMGGTVMPSKMNMNGMNNMGKPNSMSASNAASNNQMAYGQLGGGTGARFGAGMAKGGMVKSAHTNGDHSKMIAQGAKMGFKVCP